MTNNECVFRWVQQYGPCGLLVRVFGLCGASVCDSGLKSWIPVAQGAVLGEGLGCSGGKASQRPGFVGNDKG